MKTERRCHMNIMLFLTHKSDVTYLYNDQTIAEGLEILRSTSYTAVPLITREGQYVGTVTEGDFLWALNEPEIWKERETLRMDAVKRHICNKPVRAEAQIYDLMHTALHQNFVPVIDDRDCFVGIVTRQRILGYCLNELEHCQKESVKASSPMKMAAAVV